MFGKGQTKQEDAIVEMYNRGNGRAWSTCQSRLDESNIASVIIGHEESHNSNSLKIPMLVASILEILEGVTDLYFCFRILELGFK